MRSAAELRILLLEQEIVLEHKQRRLRDLQKATYLRKQNNRGYSVKGLDLLEARVEGCRRAIARLEQKANQTRVLLAKAQNLHRSAERKPALALDRLVLAAREFASVSEEEEPDHARSTVA